MDDSQRRQFRENGFLIVKDVLTQETVAHLNAIFVSRHSVINLSHLLWHVIATLLYLGEPTSYIRARRSSPALNRPRSPY